MDGVPARILWRAFALAGALTLLHDGVNVLTALQDAVRLGHPLPLWKPVTWEASSGVAEILAFPIVWWTVIRFPPVSRPWLRSGIAHLAGSLVFSFVHIALMTGIRMAVYAAVGPRYPIELAAAPYEYRKDLLSYLVIVVIFHLFTRARSTLPQAQPQSPPLTFDILDGARTLRTPLADILAVKSAGNYAEFHLQDGRRPLMRATLRELEEKLAPLGFERTHRSWLVNARRIEALEPAGSGDHALTLPGGVTVPLSRRFPGALERIRGA